MNNPMIKIQGENAIVLDNINFANVMSLRQIGEKYIRENPTVVFDFHPVKTAYSAGLTLMLSWLRCAKRCRKTIHFMNVLPSLKTMARVCDLTEILGIHDHG